MPKSTKKKKEKVADFSVMIFFRHFVRSTAYPLVLEQKAKFKLGKGKKQPTNAVDTSFKARCASFDLSSDPTCTAPLTLLPSNCASVSKHNQR